MSLNENSIGFSMPIWSASNRVKGLSALGVLGSKNTVPSAVENAAEVLNIAQFREEAVEVSE